MKHITNSVSETKKLGEVLAKKIIKKAPTKKAVIVGLEGELGAGKTTFLQGFAKGLGIKEKILSPTFILIKKFPISKFKNFYHIDCYRIRKPKELVDLGLKEILSNPQNIVAVEWVENIKKLLPPKIISIQFKFLDKNKRKIVVGF